MSKTTYERGETLTYPNHYPTLTFTPVFGHRGDFMWVEEVKAAWPEHDSEFTFVRDTIHDERVDRLVCPHCGRALAGLRWVNQGDQRYMNLFPCEEHGQFLVRVRFRRNADDNSWCANKLVYEADSGMQEYYKNKSTQSRRRGRGHSSRKNRPASKQ